MIAEKSQKKSLPHIASTRSLSSMLEAITTPRRNRKTALRIDSRLYDVAATG
jgi:hypothetical protein